MIVIISEVGGRVGGTMDANENEVSKQLTNLGQLGDIRNTMDGYGMVHT